MAFTCCVITIVYGRRYSDPDSQSFLRQLVDPEEIQLKIFRTMKGLEKVEIVRPGYDVEYGELALIYELASQGVVH